jgi:tetratricopeptide (TPR) repeat protein
MLKRFGKFLFVAIGSILIGMLIVGVWYLLRHTNIFSNFRCQQEIFAILAQNHEKMVPDGAILTILSNTTFVVQFVAWITALGAIILAIFTFLGVREWLNLIDLKQKLETEYSSYKKRFEAIEENDKFIAEFSQAKIFYIQGFLEESWGILSKLPETNYEVVLYKGLTQLRRNDYFDAITSFEKALKLPNADASRIHFNMGNVWYERKDYPRSIGYYDKAISERSNYNPAYNQKAVALRRLGKIDEALDVLKVILSIDGKDAKALYNSSRYYALLKNKTKALEYLKNAFDINPRRYKRLAENDPDFEIYKKDKDFNDLFHE